MDNKDKIINYLGKHSNRQYTMHELSLILKIAYATFYRTIDLMKDILIINKMGSSKIISLNRKNPVLKSYLVISSDEERKKYLNKYPMIRKIYQELNTNDIVVLFGSYAKYSETKRSDVDILIINKNGKKNISFFKYEVLFKIKINPIFITKKEFKLMLKDKNENIGKQVLYNHIILKNPVSFWELCF